MGIEPTKPAWDWGFTTKLRLQTLAVWCCLGVHTFLLQGHDSVYHVHVELASSNDKKQPKTAKKTGETANGKHKQGPFTAEALLR